MSETYWAPSPLRARNGLHWIPPGRPILNCRTCGARVCPVLVPAVRAENGRPAQAAFTTYVDHPLRDLNDVLIGDGWGTPHVCARHVAGGSHE